jgi:MYXO-CTERM domain-containing protein
MDRKSLGVIVSVLLLFLVTLWLVPVDDEGEQKAVSTYSSMPAANSATASPNPASALNKNRSGYIETRQNDRYAAHAALTGQTKAAATPAAQSSNDNSNSRNNPSPLESAIQTRTRVKPTPLEPRAEPYALVANSGSVNVRFSVRLIGDADPSTAVYLRQSGAESVIAMNDLGVDGDIVARDNIHGANILVDTSRLQPDTCLNYIASVKDGESEAVSSPLNLCISNVPVRTAASNTDNPVVFSDGSKAVADEIIVTARPGTRIAAIQSLAASINATIVGSIPPLNLYQLKLSAPATEVQLAALVMQLNARAEVKAASMNGIGSYAYTPNDTEYASQHGLQLVRAQDVWDIGATGSGVIVTVLDSGLDRTHPDFGTVGNCQLAENDCGGTVTDALGHGTQVAGVIAAKANNALGIAGIAHGSKIHSIQASAGTTITAAQITQGFANAAAYGIASIINASFFAAGGSGTAADWTSVCGAIEQAVSSGGVPIALVVNASGNNNLNGVFYPARCNDLNAALLHKELQITVANSVSAVDAACGSVALDQRCSTSNYGAWVDIAAPGSAIRTTTLGSSYASPTGTSFSSPMVAGAAAILKSCGVPLNQIESTLRNSANVTVPFPDGSSAPRLDIYRALLSLNHTPTAVALTNSSLNENTDTSAGMDVGTLVATDLDTCDKYSYSIAGGADATSFSIDTATNALRLSAGVLNYEAKAGYAVTVRATDYFGAFFDQALTVTVNDVNEVPSIGSQTFSVNEGSANGTAVGTVSASDPDAADTKTFSITAGNTGNAFAISPATGAITVGNSAALVFATNPVFNLTVQVTDGGGLSASAIVTVNVNSVAATNNPPNISNQTFSVSESSSNGTAVGTVLASDPDAGDSLSYSLTAGNTGGAYALSVTTGALTVGNSAALSYATTPTYALTVQVTDTGSLSASATVTLNVSAAADPDPTPTPPPSTPPASAGGGGGCSVMPAGSDPDSSLLLAMMVMLGYGARRRKG